MAKFKDIEEMLRAFQPKQVEGETRARIAVAPSKRPIPPLALWMLWTASVGALLAALFMNREFWTSKKNPEEDFHSVSRPSQQLWDFENGGHNVKVIGNTKFIGDGIIHDFEIVGNGDYALTEDYSCHRVWDLKKEVCVSVLGNVYTNSFNRMGQFIEDGKSYLSPNNDGLSIRSFPDGKLVREITPKLNENNERWHPDWYISPDGKFFIGSGEIEDRNKDWAGLFSEYCVALFDEKGNCIKSEILDEVSSYQAFDLISFSPDGSKAYLYFNALCLRMEIDLKNASFAKEEIEKEFPFVKHSDFWNKQIPNSEKFIYGVSGLKLTIIDWEKQSRRTLDLAWNDSVEGKKFGEDFDQLSYSGISPDGKILYAGREQDGVYSWDLETGKALGFWSLKNLNFTGLRFGGGLWDTLMDFCGVRLSPDGNYLYAYTVGGLICRLDIRQKDATFRFPERYFKPSPWIQFLPDGDLLLTEKKNILARLDWKKGKIIRQFIHEDEISGMALSKSGKYLLTSTGVSIAQEVRWHLWDLAEGKLLRSGLIAKARELGGPTFVNPENALEFLKPGQGVLPGKNPVLISPDESWFATAGYKVPIVKWDLKSGEELGRYGDDSDYTVGLGFGKDGEKLFSATATSFVRIYDIKSRELTSQVSLKEQYPQSHILPIVSMSYSPGMEKAMLLPWNDPPLVLDLKTMKSQVLQKSEWHGEAVSASMGEGEGWIFETGGKIWFVPEDLDLGNPPKSLDNRMTRNENTAAAHIAGLCAKGDGKTFAALNKNGSICVYQKK